MFAISADMGAVKTGKRQDALIMSTYTMSISIGMNLSTFIRTFLLKKVDYNAAAYASGIEPTAEVKQMLINMNSLILRVKLAEMNLENKKKMVIEDDD